MPAISQKESHMLTAPIHAIKKFRSLSTDQTPDSGSATPEGPIIKPSSLKKPVPAKSDPLTYTMNEVSATPVPSIGTNSHDGILGWGMPSEVAFFVSIALIAICLPLGICIYIKKRKANSRKSIHESAFDDSIDSEGSTSTRPTTAGSWLEMMKHRTETPSPPHANGDDETYYEPPKPFARIKFYARRSGRMSDIDIEREVRELEEEVRRRSKLNKLAKAEGVLPDIEGSCGECAQGYTTDERGHTQPVEGRKSTPIPFLKSAEVDGTCGGHKEQGGEEGKGKHCYTESVEVSDGKASLDIYDQKQVREM